MPIPAIAQSHGRTAALGKAAAGTPRLPYWPPASPPRLTVLVCHCACPDADAARRIAECLIAERLAACASVLPGMRSVYRWHGTVEHADEALLLIKTSRGCLAALTERVLALHPYELPELVAVEAAGGSAAYLDWVAAETAREPSGG